MVTKSKAYLIFPEDLLQAIDKLVGKRGRSKFVVEATRKELKRNLPMGEGPEGA